jgi:MFS family permease
MFELYAFWTWVPAFLAASSAARRGGVESDQSLIAFATIAIGGAGCLWGGVAADRRGREWLVTVSMAASGACCLLAPAVFGAPLALVAIVAWAWGFFVIADSAQFSALVTESVPPHAVGTALTPIVSISGWRWAFPVLALGPALGIAAIRRLVILRQRSAG